MAAIVLVCYHCDECDVKMPPVDMPLWWIEEEAERHNKLRHAE